MSLLVLDTQESLQFLGSVRKWLGLDIILGSGLWINDSTQYINREKRRTRTWGDADSKGGKRKLCQKTNKKKKVEAERKQVSELLILHSISPQHFSLHVKHCAVFRISVSPYSFLRYKSFHLKFLFVNLLLGFRVIQAQMAPAPQNFPFIILS